MEKECLELLLRGKQPVVVCPAREIETMRIPPLWKKPLEENRLLVLSPFEPTHRRINAKLAQKRNRFVAALAKKLFVLHAPPNSKSEQVTMHALGEGKRIFMLEDAKITTVFEAQIERVRLEELADRVTDSTAKETKPSS